jgi:hypothetical protein
MRYEAHEGQPERYPVHWPRVFVAVFSIALVGVGSALAWHYGSTPSASAAPQEVYVPLKDFERYQQTMAADIQDSKDKVQEQDAKIKQMSDQITQLNATLNALQTLARETQASAQPVQKAAKKH